MPNRRLTEEEVSHRCQLYGIEYISGYTGKRNKCKVRCRCGIIYETVAKTIFELKNPRCRDCGIKSKLGNKYGIRSAKDVSGIEFGKLTPIHPTDKRHGSNGKGNIVWECLCKCGNTTMVSTTNLQSGNTKSCGKCGLFRNGVKTSYAALKVNSWIPEAEHNHFIILNNGKKCNVDMAIIEKRIVIEYDPIIWHKDNEKDIKKYCAIMNVGWRVFRIVTDRKMPNKEDLLYKLNDFINNSKADFRQVNYPNA